MLYCNSPAIQETSEMGLFLEVESMDAVNKLSKRKHYLNGQRELEKKVEWQREGDVCGFSNLEVVLLQYMSSMPNLPLQIVIDACVDYKYKCGSSLMQRRGLLNPDDL